MRSLHADLVSSARQFPGKVAVEDADRDQQISYGDLDLFSDRIRDALLEVGVRPGDRVGIYSPKSIGSVLSVFGVLKAHAAYVPVDPLAPPTRNAFILNDCAVRAALVEKSLVPGLVEAFGGSLTTPIPRPLPIPDYGTDLVLLGFPVREESSGAPANLAYILYTSGSTGKPKGVMHTHSSALSFVDWCSDTFSPLPNDRFTSHAPFHFDLSILDIYVPLKHGATLVLIGEDLGKQPLRLAEMIAKRRISMWYSTPSILRLLVEYGHLDRYDYSALRVVNFAGEVFPVKHFRALKAFWPHPRYFNLYGPTETNVCTYYEVPPDIPEERLEPFPIGKTCSNDQSIVVVGDAGVEVPRGEEGELYVSGGTVMQGYWNLPQRTADAFFVDDAGTPWYKTGDVVRESQGGDYLFVGRTDRMVKRRGYRVELGEIEAALYRHPSVTEAGVVAFQDDEQGVLIKAFLNWTDVVPPSQIKMKQFATRHLPLYMIPDHFAFLPSLPKTSTDKVDYQRLKEL